MPRIRYFSPTPALAHCVSSYFWFEFERAHFADLSRAELPQIRFLVQGVGTNHYEDGRVVAGMRTQLQGPTSAPVRFTGIGPMAIFGLGLLPEGWARLIGEPADRLADRCIDLSDVLGPDVERVFDRLLLATDDRARVAAVDGFLLAHMARGRSPPVWFTRLADDWLTASPNPEVDRLVEASGMSQRSVERLCRRLYGASPKLLARKYRALGAAVRLGNGESLEDGDCADGFYDQAHFIREFKQFTGMTPKRFVVEATPVTRLTIARKRLLPGLPKLALYS
ncbi:hypothetical protein GCM10007973_04320 [Polymorphobacter multimanifer]|uniref:AraC-like DNA-binding protein n=1 Tax=Polymorphobacter multimanifer TaxID=1070431 RepID=A0A841L2Q3_9SPHN|nr:helix-turn-helix domain-containing protein [Polymorphobacter multimanifer]MBB6227099.1 AraC-like DNA-binding protein [Polymorphobacter multimanifer]GGI70482.1 hypothetical protein GCM10007973_04320 [Polymorphobacter multimanifer]